MNKSELIDHVAEATNQSKATVKAVLDAAAGVVRANLKPGKDIVLGDFGKISVSRREARDARNPSTGATIHVPAKNVVKFKPAKALADAVA